MTTTTTTPTITTITTKPLHPDDLLRPATPDDLEDIVDLRGATRENAIPRARLAQLGITPASLAQEMATGAVRYWVVARDGRLVAMCGADCRSGEVHVVAVRSGHEGRGLGLAVLAAAVDWLRASGCPRIWLMAAGNPAWRAHGFYRANGWVATGVQDGRGDDEMVWEGAGG